MKQKIPLGVSDYKEMIEEGYYYVDKTLFIQELLEGHAKVALLLRPRRFGKTLNISMLRYFFERSDKDQSHLFSKFNIWQNTTARACFASFPVIYLTFKGVKQTSWLMALERMADVIASEFRRHQYLLDSVALTSQERQKFVAILSEKASQAVLEGSLSFLSHCLYSHFQRKVVILIDEYDTPIHSSYMEGYYEQLLPFMRNWLSDGLKDNPSMERGVLTGILRVARASIFSGLNNAITYTLFDAAFSDKFGLVDQEVHSLLVAYELVEQHPVIRSWYNGYLIGSTHLYNPWSILQCVANGGNLMPYWVNTSDNALVKRLITRAEGNFKGDLEELMQNRCIIAAVQESMDFKELEKDSQAVWVLLLFSGYLTLARPPSFDRGLTLHLQIPNREVYCLYETIIRSWFSQTISDKSFTLFLQSLISGDMATFSELFQRFLMQSMSSYDIPADEPEKVYHAFVLGMLLGLDSTYEVKSNRESGLGRYDVLLIPRNPALLGIVFEFKKVNPERESMKEAAELALAQIERRQYSQELRQRGVRKILAIGIAFLGKTLCIEHCYHS